MLEVEEGEASEVTVVVVGMNKAILVSLQTTTRMVSKDPERGSWSMKSIEILDQGRFSMGRG
jgi:hypothetical protein